MESVNFNSKTARKLVGLSQRQLDYWDRAHIVKPSVQGASGRGSVRLYSLLNLVQLRVVRVLRDAGLSLQKIRKSLNWLRKNMPDAEGPPGTLRFITDGVGVFVLAPDPEALMDALNGGQPVFTIVSLDRLIADLRESVRNLSQRSRYKVKVKRREFDVVMEPDLEDGGFIVECPSLPGCVSQGDSVEEALFMIGDAIEGRLEIEEGQSPRGRVA